MAAPRPHVVASGPDSPHSPHSTPASLRRAAGAGSSRVMLGAAGPHLSDSGYHYESPNEENQLAFFSQRPSQQRASSTDAQGGGPSRLSRPVLLSRPSHIVSLSPSSSPNADNGYGLDTVMSRAEKLGPDHKVGIKDRIACYKWTYFTMVRVSLIIQQNEAVD